MPSSYLGKFGCRTYLPTRILWNRPLKSSGLKRTIEELEAIIVEKEKQISDLKIEKGGFFRVVSHDLRSPISRIIGFADLLKKDLENNEELRFFAENIEAAGWHLNKLIARIMEVEEFESEEEEPTIELQDVVQPVRDKVAYFVQEYIEKEIDYELTVSDPSLKAPVDNEYWNLIVINLLSNAGKFSKAGSSVWVTLDATSEGAARLVVADEGPGFKPEEKSLIFKKFAKLSAKPTGGEIAAGLGLYQAWKCTQALGGTITAEDNEPVGTKFTVIIP